MSQILDLVGRSLSFSLSLFLLRFPRLVLNSMSFIRCKLRPNYERCSCIKLKLHHHNVGIHASYDRLSFDKLTRESSSLNSYLVVSEALIYEHVFLCVQNPSPLHHKNTWSKNSFLRAKCKSPRTSLFVELKRRRAGKITFN